MSSVKLGDRLLVVGCSDTRLVAALAIKAGLTGRTCMVDESESLRTHAAVAVEREGALVESFAAPYTSLPFDSSAFDVVVMRNVLTRIDPERRQQMAAESQRVLRPGGRCTVIEGEPRRGVGGLFRGTRRDQQHRVGGDAEEILTSVGFRAVRTLAEREGLVFVEGVKARVEPVSG